MFTLKRSGAVAVYNWNLIISKSSIKIYDVKIRFIPADDSNVINIKYL